jgi:hypothetical protein
MNEMVFVMGCAHGGTTLMATILGSHSEYHLIPTETCAYDGTKWSTKNDLIKEINKSNSTKIIEKTPSHVFNINLIKDDFPSSHFVVMVRNPLDVVASIYARHGDFNKSIYRCLNDLTGCLSAIKREDAILVEYEDVISNFDLTISKVCNRLGVDFQNKMRDFHSYSPEWFSDYVSWDEHLSLRAWQMKQPLFDGRGRGKKELNQYQIDKIIQDCSDKYMQITGKSID